MQEKIAIISDIHGNSPALKAVFDDIRRAGCSQLFLLGDIAAGLDPAGCITLLHEWGDMTCIRGNADLYVLTPDLESMPRREEPMEAEVIRLIQWIRSRLRTSDLEWLQSMPDLIYRNESCFVHASLVDRLFPERWHITGIDEKYQEWFYHSQGIRADIAGDELTLLLRCMESQNVSRLFCGHTHIPFIRRVGAALICNVGSVGMPLDGDPRPSWVLLGEMPGGGVDVGIRRVAYDVDQILHLADITPDYPDFKRPMRRAAYKQMLITGNHWRAFVNDDR